MATIDDVCDYIICKCADDGLSLLKLQKLLYYCQAWFLAFGKGRLFSGKFQAWVHGPVNRHIYDRFKDEKVLYSSVSAADMRSDFSYSRLSPDERAQIDAILTVYAAYTGDQLEEMAHQEEPWMAARCGIAMHERCENEIDEDVMTKYYRARLNK